MLNARALDRGGGEDDSEDRPGARRPQQAGGDAEHQRGPDALLPRPPALLRQARTERDQRPGHPVRQRSGRPERSRTERAGPAPPSGRSHWRAPPSRRRPPPASRRRRRSTAIPTSSGNVLRMKLPPGAGEHERQHRQDARADDGQDSAEISEQDDQHRCACGTGWLATALTPQQLNIFPIPEGKSQFRVSPGRQRAGKFRTPCASNPSRPLCRVHARDPGPSAAP